MLHQCLAEFIYINSTSFIEIPFWFFIDHVDTQTFRTDATKSEPRLAKVWLTIQNICFKSKCILNYTETTSGQPTTHLVELGGQNLWVARIRETEMVNTFGTSVWDILTLNHFLASLCTRVDKNHDFFLIKKIRFFCLNQIFLIYCVDAVVLNLFFTTPP